MFYIGCIVLLVVLEQAVKHAVKKNLEEGEKRPRFHGKIILTRFHNKGAAFGKITKKPGTARMISILALAALAGVFFPVYFRKENGILKLGTSLLAAGGISNVLDRVRQGYVVDYISFPGKKGRKCPHYVYNVADFFIFSGVGLNLLSVLVEEKQRRLD